MVLIKLIAFLLQFEENKRIKTMKQKKTLRSNSFQVKNSTDEQFAYNKIIRHPLDIAWSC